MKNWQIFLDLWAVQWAMERGRMALSDTAAVSSKAFAEPFIQQFIKRIEEAKRLQSVL